MAAELVARGHDVVVWTTDLGDVNPPEVVDGVRVRRLPTPMPARRSRSLVTFAVHAPLTVFRWGRALATDRPQVLHVHCFAPTGVWATAFARVTRRALVVSSHGETFMDADGVFDRSTVLRHALRWSLRRADVVTGCSACTVKDLERRFGLEPGRGLVVPNGVEPDEPAGALPDGWPRRYLLAVGRVVRPKGFDLLLAALAVADLPGDVVLVVGGDGPELGALREQARALGIAGRVVFPGRLDRGQVVAAMAGAIALIVPSRVEAFGIVVLEGWRAGVPVVVTSHGGPAEFVTHGVDGLVVDPVDTTALADALRTVVRDGPTAHRLSAAGARAVTAYTWGRVVDEYEAVYAALARR